MKGLIYVVIGVGVGVFLADNMPEIADQVRVWTNQAMTYITALIANYS